MSNNWDWLHNLFGEYDLYYLDPLIVKDPTPPGVSFVQKTRVSLFSRFRNPSIPRSPWFTQDLKAAKDLFSDLRKILEVNPANSDLSEFFEGEVQSKLLGNRPRQTEVANKLVADLARTRTKADSNGFVADRKFERTSLLSEEPERLKGMPNRNMSDCLIIVDGVISKVDAASHPELYNSVVVSASTIDRRTRNVRFCLGDRPWPLLGLGDHCVGLMVDQKALLKTYPDDGSTEVAVDVVGLNHWYPFAKIVGFWRTDRGGRHFIDVVAILVKTFPTMDQIFRQRAGNAERKFIQLLTESFSAVCKQNTAIKNGGRYDAQNDYQLLYPFLLGTLCCQLNHVDLTGQGARSKGLYALFDQYRTELLALVGSVGGRTSDSLIPAYLPL